TVGEGAGEACAGGGGQSAEQGVEPEVVVGGNQAEHVEGERPAAHVAAGEDTAVDHGQFTAHVEHDPPRVVGDEPFGQSGGAAHVFEEFGVPGVHGTGLEPHVQALLQGEAGGLFQAVRGVAEQR